MVVTLFAAIVIVSLGASLAGWVVVIRRLWSGREIVAWEPRRSVPWGLLDFVVAFGLPLITGVLALKLLAAWQEPAPLPLVDGSVAVPRGPEILAQSLATFLSMCISAAIIWVRFRASLRDFGLVAAKIASDIRLGLAAFVILAPPTYALQMILVRLMESKHPLIELIRTDPDPTLIGICVFSAVLVAPLTEEYLFRGLLQGWLERLANVDEDPVRLILGGAPEPQKDATAATSGQVQSEDLPDRETVAKTTLENPYVPPIGPASEHESGKRIDAIGKKGPQPQGTHRPALWPILGSALLFSAMHITHGPDWVPLFFLAIGLGYLYRQTHRLLPCIVVHFLLNAVSMGMFLWEVFHNATGN
jgi:membrane protease YdiL (CAAX protease family)